MPIYTYRCLDCDHIHEVIQKASDPPVEKCDRCDGKLKKVFHPAGIVFKGSGFYVNDSKGSAGSNGSSDS